LIASGTRPRIPNIEGLEGSGYITSDEALRLKKQPKVLTIIGGGYIACELAHFFWRSWNRDQYSTAKRSTDSK
jgi:dihydrolipoamide dehydrogenase